MLNRIEIVRRCAKCGGSSLLDEQQGDNPPTQKPCISCENGYQEFYFFVLPNGFFYSTDIFNCIVSDEYSDLSAKNKDYVGMVLSLGICNLNEGSKEKELLMQLFEDGTQTRLNLIELIG